MADATIDLPPEADAFVNRVRKVEGTAAGAGYVTYGNKAFTPGKDFPQWEGADLGDGRKTHAAGPGQWQPDTWKEQKDKFKGYGLDLDFSNETHQKAAIWDKGYEEYKKATGRDLRADLKANKVEWSALAPTWQGFQPRVTQSDKPGGRIDPSAIGYAQSRPHQSVWYMDPEELMDNLPPIEKDEADKTQGASLSKSLQGGDPIYDLPEIEVSDKGGTRKISSYDGRHRLRAMIDAGLTAVPVVIKGLEPGVRPDAIEGMTGKTMPIRFDPVPAVPYNTLPGQPNRRTLGQGMETDRQAQFEADRRASAEQSMAHQQGAADRGKVYYNEAGQPFTLSGAPTQQQPQQGSPAPAERLPGEIPYVGRLSDQIAGIIQGAAQGGRMITGEEPVTRMLPENVVGAAAALGGTPLPPFSRFTPGLPRIAPEGRNMLAAAQEARGMEFPRPVPMERITPERAALAQEALQRNIPITGVQNPAAQIAKERALQRAISHTFGEDAPALTPEVLGPAKRRIGQRMGQIERGHRLPFDPPLYAKMNEIETQASKLLTKKEFNIVKSGLDDVRIDHAKTAAAKQAAQAAPKTPGKPAAKPKEVLRSGLSGEQFANLVHDGGTIAQLADHPKDGVAMFGQKIEDALRDLLQRRLPPETAIEYRELRHQYKNLKTVEPAVGPAGQVDFDKLDRSVARKFPDRRTDQKPTELVKLTDIAKEFAKPPKPPEPVSPWVRAAEVGAGALAGHLLGGPIGGAAGAAIALGGHSAARNLMRSMMAPRLTEKLIMRALAELPPPGARKNAINALMARTGASTLTVPPAGRNAMSVAASPFRLPTGGFLSPQPSAQQSGAQ